MMGNMTIRESLGLIAQHGIISDQVQTNELAVIIQQAAKALSIGGAYVEFGCYSGTTSLYLQRLLATDMRHREFHVYDSFEGLPEKTTPDISPVGEQFIAGELAASKKAFILNFKKAGLPLPVIHKGWFGNLNEEDIPDMIAFAFLDGDYYDSILDPLRLIWPHLSPGAIVVVDDYANEALPGAQKAVDKWLQIHQGKLSVIHSLAVIHT